FPLTALIDFSGRVTQPVLENVAPSGMITGPTFPGGAFRTWAESGLPIRWTVIVQQAWRCFVLSRITAVPEPCGGPFGTDAALVSFVDRTLSKCFGAGFVSAMVTVLDVVALVVGAVECELPQPAAITPSATIAMALVTLKLGQS